MNDDHLFTPMSTSFFDGATDDDYMKAFAPVATDIATRNPFEDDTDANNNNSSLSSSPGKPSSVNRSQSNGSIGSGSFTSNPFDAVVAAPAFVPGSPGKSPVSVTNAPVDPAGDEPKSPDHSVEKDDPPGEDSTSQPYVVDVAQLEQDVDQLLDGRNVHECKIVLRSMVLDLLLEVENLRIVAKTKQEKISALKQEKKVLQQDNKEQIRQLYQAVVELNQKKFVPVNFDGDNDDSDPDSPKKSFDCINSTKSKLEETRKKPKKVGIDDASLMVVEGLTNQLSEVQAYNRKLQKQLAITQDKYDDMASKYSAANYKVEALETQFKFINKTRQKVVNKLVDRSSNNTSMNTSFTASSPRPVKKSLTAAQFSAADAALLSPSISNKPIVLPASVVTPPITARPTSMVASSPPLRPPVMVSSARSTSGGSAGSSQSGRSGSPGVGGQPPKHRALHTIQSNVVRPSGSRQRSSSQTRPGNLGGLLRSGSASKQRSSTPVERVARARSRSRAPAEC
jgi:hypothetical protein